MSDLALTDIGGPTVLIEFGGWRLRTDPTFDPFAGQPETMHWSLPDPAAGFPDGDHEARYPAFQQAAAELDTRIGFLLAALDHRVDPSPTLTPRPTPTPTPTKRQEEQ